MSMKIVVDTNVFISALISSTGSNRKLIRQCLLGEYSPLMGNALFCEYEDVINRDRISEVCPLSKKEIHILLNSFMSVCQWVQIYYLWRPKLIDEQDNHLIELSVAGQAEYLVTNNIKDFKQNELLFPNLEIVTPTDLIKRSNTQWEH